MEPVCLAEIPVWYGGYEKWITGIHKRTTCEDVVRALISSHGGKRGSVESHKDYNDYVLVERWRKVERALDGKSKILKLWNKWGEERCNVKLSLKKIQQPQLKDTTNIRQGRRHHSKGSSSAGSKSWHPKKLSLDGTVDMSETVDKLMKLIMSQTETISYQLSKLLDKDKQIEQFETQIHELRMTQIGANYVQDAYLQETATGSDEKVAERDEKLSEEETEKAIEMYEEILNLCLRLEKEENTIVSLEAEVKDVHTSERGVEEGLGAQEGSVVETIDELEKVKSELERLNAVYRTRENVLSQNDKFIIDSDRTLDDKRLLMSQLEQDLESADRETERLRHQYELLCVRQPDVDVYKKHPHHHHQVEHYPSIVNTSPINCKGETESLDSDTGLSSLHSSSDEGGYVLDTLV